MSIPFFGKPIYVACPMNYRTGGVELLYQLVNELKTTLNANAHLFFQGNLRDYHPIPDYQNYQIDPVFFDEVGSNFSGIMVIPEVMTYLLARYPLAQKMIWWESVDNYCGGGAGSLCPNFFDSIQTYGFFCTGKRTLKKVANSLFSNRAYAKFPTIKKNACLHLVQSQYAYLYLKQRGIPNEHIKFLSDYINDCFLSETIDVKKKENIVLYNPKKGLSFTKKIISHNPFITFIPLEGLDNGGMINLFKRAKLYIDFGNHPGRDRMPREAASLMCCIIVGKNGSARNLVDIPIPEKYKFVVKKQNISKISELISEIFEDYSSSINDFSSYRSAIAGQKREFLLQMKSIFEQGELSL